MNNKIKFKVGEILVRKNVFMYLILRTSDLNITVEVIFFDDSSYVDILCIDNIKEDLNNNLLKHYKIK